MFQTRPLDLRPPRWLALACLVCLVAVAGAAPSMAQKVTAPSSADSAERQVAWRVADADCSFQIHHQRRETVHDADQPVESIRVTAGNGTHIHIVTALEPVRLVDETEIVLPIKSDRRRLQLLARVVLPRTKDPATGAPITILVRGQLYQDVNNWQRLMLTDIPRKRDSAARALRLALDSKVDVRESYVDLLGLNMYGGRGTTTVHLATAEVDGQPQTSRLPDRREIATKTRNTPIRPTVWPSGNDAGRDSIRQASHGEALSSSGNESLRIKTDGNLFFVEGRPKFIRMIDHQGESFTFLRRLGFNAIRLPRTATDDDLSSAARHGMWLVCPPPNEHHIRRRAADFERVIAWDLGDRLTTRDFETVVRRVQNVRARDDLESRPLLAGVDTDLHAYSSHLDVLLHDRAPLGTSLPLQQFGAWLADRPRLSRPAIMHWAAIQTEPLPALEQQWQAFQFPSIGRVSIETSQLRHLVFAAVGAGMRGLLFRSRSSLQANETTAQTRAAMLQLVNAELDRIEPWAAGGKRIGSADTDAPNTTTYVLHAARGQLVCVLQAQPGDQYVPSPTDASVTVTIPGVPVAHEVYQLTDAGLKTLTAQRVAGGMRIVLERFVSPTFVLLTRNPLVVNNVSQRASQSLNMIARLRHQLADEARTRTQAVADDLALQGIRLPRVEQELERARTMNQQAQSALEANQSRLSADLARQATGSVVAAQHALWTRSNRALPAPVASPLCTQLDTLPWHWHLVRYLPASPGTFNLLKSGDFEAGRLNAWQSLEHAPTDVSVRVELTDGVGYDGGRCLRLRAEGRSEAAKQSVMESPLIWVNSPPVTVRAHQIVKIQGVLKVPSEIVGSSDGVLVFDSLGGPEIGVRALKTNGWEPFVLYRVPEKHHQSVALTVALTGLGEVLIDHVMITPVATIKNAHSEAVESRRAGGRH